MKVKSSPELFYRNLYVNLYVIFQRYEESQLHESIYQLHVKLLAADKSTVISEHIVQPVEDLSTYSHTWKEVRY